MDTRFGGFEGNIVAGGRGGASHATYGRGRGRTAIVQGAATHGSGLFDLSGSGFTSATQFYPATSQDNAGASCAQPGFQGASAERFHGSTPTVPHPEPAQHGDQTDVHHGTTSINVNQAAPAARQAALGQRLPVPAYLDFIDDATQFDHEHIGLFCPFYYQINRESSVWAHVTYLNVPTT